MTGNAELSAIVAVLRDRRRKMKLTQAAAAQRLGISENTIMRYETGRTVPSLETTRRWATALGTSLGALAVVEADPATVVAIAADASRAVELSEIEAFVATHGVTRVPSSRDPALAELDRTAPLVWDFKTRRRTRRTHGTRTVNWPRAGNRRRV